ncbi:hypothetical protein HZA39_02210 [Candidatus Peregrinibacteria bacterium]|nr:hypothetical protein [Candidatus Peregrinibacteria bacterium]
MSDDAKKGGYKIVSEKPGENPNESAESQKEKDFGFIEAEKEKEAVIGEKKDVKGEGLKGRGEVGREVLKSEVSEGDKETEAEINKLPNKLPETKEEKEAFESLKIVISAGILIDEFKKMKTQVDLAKIKNFEYVRGLNPEAFKNSADKAAIKKLQEIAENPESPLYKKLSAEWPKIVEKSYENYQTASYVKQKMENKNKEPEGFTDKAKRYGKEAWETAKAHPVLFVAGALAGGYGLYRFFKWMKGGKKGAEAVGEKKEGAGIWGWTKRLLWAGGIAFVAGRICGFETVQRWAEKIGMEKAAKFLNLISRGKFKEAWELVSKGLENEKIYDTIIANIEREKKVKVSSLTLRKISIFKYGKFMQEGIITGKIDKTKESAENMLTEKLPKIAWALDFSADEQKDIKIIREYFAAHDIELKQKGITPESSMLEAYEMITGEKITVAYDVAETQEYKTLQDALKFIKDPVKRENVERTINITFSGFGSSQKFIKKEFIEKFIEGLKKRGVNLSDISELQEELVNRQKALSELRNLIIADVPYDDINGKIAEAADHNDDLVDLIDKRYGWTEFAMLVPQGIMFAYWYKGAGAQGRELSKYIGKKMITSPLKAKELFSHEPKTIAEFKTAADKIEEGINSKGFKPLTEEESLKLSKLEGKTLELKDDFQEYSDLQGKKALSAEVDALKQKKAIYLEKAELLDAKEQLKLAQESGNKSAIASLEKQITDLNAKIDKAEVDLINLKEKYILTENEYTTKYMLNENRAKIKGEVLSEGGIEKLDKFERDVEGYVDDIGKKVVEKKKLAEDLVNAGKRTEADEVIKEVNSLSEKLTTSNKVFFENIQKEARFLRGLEEWLKRNIKFLGEKNVERVFVLTRQLEQVILAKTRLKDRFITFIRTTKGASYKFFGRQILPCQTWKGKMVFCSVLIGAGAWAGSDKKTSLLEAGGQTAVDIAPFSGTFSDFYSVFSGKELVTKRKLDFGDRMIRLGFGAAGLVCDVGTFFFGLGLAGRTTLSTIRAGKVAIKSTKILKLAAGAEKAGGIAKNAKLLKTGKWARRAALTGGLGYAGYSIVMKPAGEMQIDEDTREVLGDALQEVSPEHSADFKNVEASKT